MDGIAAHFYHKGSNEEISPAAALKEIGCDSMIGLKVYR